MQGRVLRRTNVNGITHLIVDAGAEIWQVSIKPVLDFNSEITGYATWIRRHSDQHETEDAAIQSGLAWVETLSGVEIADGE